MRLKAYTTAVGLALLLIGSQSAADHPLLSEDPALTLAEVTDRAIEQAPERLTLAPRFRQADAWQKRGSSLLSGNPSLSLRYQTDRWQNDHDLTEYEGGLTLPLWNFGARRAARSVAAAQNAEANQAEAFLRWQIAGQVREQLWELAAARSERENAERALHLFEQIGGLVERRHKAGDVARADLLLAQSASLEAESAVLSTRAREIDASRKLQVLTGLTVHPPFVTETLSQLQSIPMSHPALAMARSERGRANAFATLARKTAKGQPSITIGPRREHPADGLRSEDSVGITLNVPLGGSGAAATAVAAADVAAAEALAEHDRVQRQLRAMLHEAKHELEVTREALSFAERNSKLLTDRLQAGERAYELGELSLPELLRMQRMTLTSTARKHQLTVQLNHRIAAYNQAAGVTP